MSTRRYSLSWWLVATASSAIAQSWVPCSSADLLAHKATSDARYTALNEFDMRVHMASFRSMDDVLAFDEANSTIHRRGEAYRSEQLGLITLQKGELRVTIDAGERLVLVDRPATDEVQLLSFASTTIIAGAASCAKRSSAGGLEFKLVFGGTAVYDHMIVQYDAQGWLRRTETHWRQAIPEYPDDPKTKSYRPKLVMTYQIPQKPKSEAVLLVTDPNTVVAQHDGSAVAIGPYSGYSVFDTRTKQ